MGKLPQRAATEEAEDATEGAARSPAGVDEDEDGNTDEEMITAAELETEAKIIGTKEFDLDNVLLDDYLERVLAWWYGERPPQGVDVELTRRCVYVASSVSPYFAALIQTALEPASIGMAASGERRRRTRRCRSIGTAMAPR